MKKSTITGTDLIGISLTDAAYANPVTISSGARVLTGGMSIVARSNSWNINNFGYIDSLRSFGIALLEGGTVTNETSGHIIGYSGIAVKRAAGTVKNAGVIVAVGIGDSGIGLWDGGSVTNAAHASIYSAFYSGVYGGRALTAIDNLGSVKGFQFGVIFRDGGSVTNAAGGSISSLSDIGVYLTGRGLCSVVNSGSITGYNYGVFLGDAGGTITNGLGAAIKGEKKDGIHAWGPATVRNAGIIAGGRDAVYFQGAGDNRLIVQTGASFNGAVKAAATGSNTIELVSSASAGTLKNLGSQYLGFQTVTIDSGAAWTIAGAKSGFTGVKIEGFSSKDALDLTNVAFAAGDTATVSGTDVLTVKNAHGTTLATAQLSGTFTGVKLTVAGDGAAGIKITETASLPTKVSGSVGIDLAASGGTTNGGSTSSAVSEATLPYAGGMITNIALTRFAETVAAHVGHAGAALDLSTPAAAHGAVNQQFLAASNH
jgi:hypothetical protein